MPGSAALVSPLPLLKSVAPFRAFCMAIDIASVSVSTQLYAEILERIPQDYASARAAFDEALRVNTTSVKAQSRCTSSVDKSHQRYASVIDLAAFLDHYVIPSCKSALTHDDRKLTEALFFSRPGRVSLESITTPWCGPNGVVWVLAAEDIETRIESRSPVEAATLLHDGLGLWDFWDGTMVIVRYPLDSSAEYCAKPTALDASWRDTGSCYLSGAESGNWGRTQSRSGQVDTYRERVHLRISKLNREFSAERLASPELKRRDSEALRSEAQRRLSVLGLGDL
jgi:hypothetical protein